LAALAAALLGTTILAIWNWAVASHVHEWSTDPKNTYLFIAKRLEPAVLQRDFPFSDTRIFRFYQPLYMGVAVRLARWFGSIIPATRVLHFAFTFAYFLGWILLGGRLGSSWSSLLLFLVALVPYVPISGADGIGVGAPGTWWSRSMANAFVPWFGLLAELQFRTGDMVVWGCVLIGVLLHIHPVVSVGLFPAFAALLAVDVAMRGRLPVGDVLAGVGLLAIFGAAFVWLYSRSSSKPANRRIDWQRVNDLAFKRFRLWPYAIIPENGSAAIAKLNRFLHLAVGAIYLAAAGAALLLPLPSQAARHYALTILNVVALVFLHMPPGEGMGVRLAVLAAFGAAHTLSVSGSFGVAIVLGLLVLSRFRLRKALLGLAALVTIGVLALPVLDAQRWQMMTQRGVSPFEWWLASAIPAVFAWYLIGSLVTMDLLPLRLHQPLKIIDWGRTAKIVQLPMYCYVLWFAQDIVRIASSASAGAPFTGVALVGLFLGNVLVNPLSAYRRDLHHGDRGLFEWAKQRKEDSLFHIVSSDIWFGFDFRANTLRSITGTWKDGGICHYSDVERFFEWDARMRLMAEGLQSGKVSTLVAHGQQLGADFIVIDRRVSFDNDSTHEAVFSNERWEVRPLVSASHG
jgi:hypothetical protein